MLKLYTMLVTFLTDLQSDDEGATAVEYGLMVALIAAAVVTVVTGLGNKLVAVFSDVTSKLP